MVVAEVVAVSLVQVLMEIQVILELVELVAMAHLLKSQVLMQTVAVAVAEPLAELAVMAVAVLVLQVLKQLLEMELTIKEAAEVAVEVDHILMLLELVDLV